ncbi:MAG: P-II family nitrogen regulator [Clostridia bacterium]|nr:P-II family nitrogen regulator [Clostridia bacterium]
MELNFVVSVIDRSTVEIMSEIYRELDLPLVLTLLGHGTATSEQLAIHGLVASEKALVISVADGDKTSQLIKNAKRKLFIDIPGNGIMMAVPVKSIGGGKTLAYLTNNSTPSGNGTTCEKFDHELIIVVLNQSYMDDVMNAARAGGAMGGTVLHAKGSNAKTAEKFLGVSLANEKEVVLIVTKTEQKAAIMKSIMEQTGPNTPAGAITFSLPVSSVAGLREIDSDK